MAEQYDYVNNVICGDCLDVMRELPDDSVDLVVTDPPYNVGIDYGDTVNDKMTDEDYIEWMIPRFREMQRIAKTVVISTGVQRLWNFALIKKWDWLLCWYKPAAMGRCTVGFTHFEPIALWGHGENRGCDVIKAPLVVFPAGHPARKHPCPKPLKWATGIINLFPTANLILDPFAGSGTTLVAAKELDRNFIGIEINPQYVDICNKRLNAVHPKLIGLNV